MDDNRWHTMTSLGDAYDRKRRAGRDPRRILAGAALLVAGGLALVAAILLVATAAAGGGTTAKHYAGALAGLGIPAMLLGVVGGAVLTVAGVALFWHAYPAQWTRAGGGLTFETTMVYFVGAVIALWYVFTAIATFRRRNTPHGTVRMEVVRQGSTRTIEVSEDRYRRIVSDGGDPTQIIRELDD